MPAIGADIAARPGRAVEQAGAAPGAKRAARPHCHDDPHHVRRPVDDGRVDHRAAPGARGVQKPRQHPRHQIERAAPDIADQRGRRDGFLSRDRGIPERPGQRDVVEVVPSRMRARAALAPAGHAAIDQRGIERLCPVGAEAQTFHDAGAKALDQRVGAADQRLDRRAVGRGLEVERDGTLATIEQVALGDAGRGAARALDADHLGAKVGQHHRGKGAGSQPFEFQDADSVKHDPSRHPAPEARI